MNPDVSFLWFGDEQRNAFSTLRYGIQENKGFLLLTGAPGSGKTTLTKALTDSLEKDVVWAVINDPKLERIDFYNAIAKGFGINVPFTSKVQFLIQFSQFLHKADDENKKVLLLVDDCHCLSQETLEEIRLLSNIEKADAKLINIFFVGRPEFNKMLVEPRNRAVSQRLTLKIELPALNVAETEDYVRHRLKVAGTVEELFTAKAIQAVWRASRGIPRRINAICDQALVSGSVQGKKTIDHKMVESCLRNIDLPVGSDLEEIVMPSDEKNDFSKIKEIFIPNPIDEVPSPSGFNLESDHRRGWAKYGIGLLVVAAFAGLYSWFSVIRSPESVKDVPVDVVQVVKDAKVAGALERQTVVEVPKSVANVEVPVAKSISQVSSSPAVTMLEENKSEMNGERAAALKSAILEKAYNANGNKQEENVGQVAVEVAKVDEPGGNVHQAVESVVADITERGSVGWGDEKTENIQQAVALDKFSEVEIRDEETADLAESAEQQPVQVATIEQGPEVESVPEPVVEPEKQEEKEAVKMAPLEPKKIILGLQPNVLKLTNASKKEFQQFVKKLKLYPRATVFVKGYVSAQTNSPENIALSKDRALSVQKLMLAEGIDAEQIEVVGMGNQEPIASNTTSEGRRKNRRVEIVVIDDGI